MPACDNKHGVVTSQRDYTQYYSIRFNLCPGDVERYCYIVAYHAKQSEADGTGAA